jgi:hypothetical protein
MAQDDNEQPTAGSDDGEAGRGDQQLDVRSIADYAMEQVQEQARTHPFRTLGLAMGVGYVLGGGVPKFLVRLGLLAAGRLMADAVTAEGLRTLSTNLMGADDDADLAAGQPPGERQPRAKNGHHRRRGASSERHARRT